MHAHTPAEIAQVIKPQFDDTDMETLTAIVKRYQEQDTWKDSLIFEKTVSYCFLTFWKVPVS